jgi:hypothetical protein
MGGSTKIVLFLFMCKVRSEKVRPSQKSTHYAKSSSKTCGYVRPKWISGFTKVKRRACFFIALQHWVLITKPKMNVRLSNHCAWDINIPGLVGSKLKSGAGFPTPTHVMYSDFAKATSTSTATAVRDVIFKNQFLLFL